jgi:hypothetical protein
MPNHVRLSKGWADAKIINVLMPDMSQISGQQMARAETINYLIVVQYLQAARFDVTSASVSASSSAFCFLSASPGLARVMVLLGLGQGSPMHLESVLS